MTDATLRPDICVIGAGAAGLSVAAGAAAFGVPVVLIERGAMGGECLHVGCVPSKALLAAAHHVAALKEAPQFGIGMPGQTGPAVDWAALNRHVRGVIDAVAPNDAVERFTALGVRVIQAEARFVDRRTVEAGGLSIRARRFVLATGSSPAIPPIPGLDAVPFLTNETIFDLKRPPGHLVVLGAGAVGVELAQAHRRLGAAVTLVTRGKALSQADPELARFVLRRLRSDGVAIHENAANIRAERRGRAGVRLIFNDPAAGGIEARVEGTHLLVAAGRAARPVPGLDAAGIRFGKDGVAVSRGLRTSNRRVYAVGDAAAGRPRFTHAAGHEAGVALRAILFRLPARADGASIPRTLYADPELAEVGLSEGQARERGVLRAVLRWPMSENDRAQAERRTEGEIKILVGKGGRVLGAGVVGPQAGELIQIWCLAVAKGLKIRDFAGTVLPYPTLGEVGKRAAVTYFAAAARARWTRRLLAFLRFWG